jgi:hypothetical protein
MILATNSSGDCKPGKGAGVTGFFCAAVSARKTDEAFGAGSAGFPRFSATRTFSDIVCSTDIRRFLVPNPQTY